MHVFIATPSYGEQITTTYFNSFLGLLPLLQRVGFSVGFAHTSLLPKARNELASNLRQQPGFVSYQVAKLDGNRTASFAVFETRAGAENGARIIEEWVKKNMAKDVLSSQMHLGELAIDSTAGTQPEMHA